MSIAHLTHSGKGVLCEGLCKQLGYTEKKALCIVNAFLSILKINLGVGNRVSLGKLGFLEIVDRDPQRRIYKGAHTPYQQPRRRTILTINKQKKSVKLRSKLAWGA